jgi:DNA-binding GntR family transcriptional regulator
MKDSGSVARVYVELQKMAADFVFKPGERLNESRLSEQLGASRTPLREALNRLVAEGFLTFEPGKGFSCRTLRPEDIQSLYELRGAIECEALRYSLDRASDAEIAALSLYLDRSEPEYLSCCDPLKLVQMDQTFHIMLAELAGNPEFVRTLKNVNDRIRYVRMIDLNSMRRDETSTETLPMRLSAHRQIVDALQSRNEADAISALRAHIERRRDQTIVAVRNAFAQIYVTAD